MKFQLAHFVEWVRKSSLAVSLGIIIGGATTFLIFTEHLFTITDRLGWTESQSFVLAEDSSKAKLSEQISDNAWSRMFYANLFAFRVEKKASLADLDDAWKSYIAADAEWNTNLMTNIVGIERYYGEKKSFQFETDIQYQFKSLDDAMGNLRASKYLSDLRNQTPVGSDLRDALALAGTVHSIHDKTQRAMYVFVRCIPPPPPRASAYQERDWACKA